MIVRNEQEMLDFGRSIAPKLRAGDWLAIDGPLGAGKTVFCKGILQGLGYEGDVASPSYAIVHQYLPPDVTIALIHADLYRLKGTDELEELGLTDDSQDCITLVEWAKRSGANFGNPTYHINIVSMDDGSRQIGMRINNG
jgi:tRNA threonylcarbamoyladenosine biosynthesis protein TsaE